MNKSDLNVIEGGDPIRRQAAAWFARLRADDVSEHDRQQWQRWLALDARHRLAYQRIERLWSTLGEFAPHPEVSQRIDAAPAVVATPSRQTGTRARRRFAGAAFAVAAAVLVAVAVGRWIVVEPAPTELHYVTGIGERRSLQLEDGTHLALDTDTRLHVRYSRQERRIVIDHGRAYFRVAKEARPLVVRSDSGSVRAVGTQFEVFRRSGELAVALFEGRVELLAAGDPDTPTAPLATLAPGQRARIDGRRVQWEAPLAAATTAPAWLSGRLVFDDTALAEAVAEFNRYSQPRLALEGTALAQRRISGVFRSDDPEGFIEALHDVYGITEARSVNGERVLRERR